MEETTPFKKILIANRGEIAIRILRTCRELGIATVSVHSTADESSLHVKLADESVCIGPEKSIHSYLNMSAILSAAEITGADAVHPGFGFLSENLQFARLCNEWNINFIGPSSLAIEQMGDKIRSKELAIKAGLPILMPVLVKNRSYDEIVAAVKEMGFPILIKSSAGGGGKGMKRIDNFGELQPSLDRLASEAKASFGDDTLFIEKYIERPRHVEVQILADKYGNILHLGERDCTIQRRFQKLVEESPCPVIDEKTRRAICEAAVNLAKFVNYDSVGTVEFLYDQDTKKFYFMEMNTRIQVEHPVTEMRTGLDLIAQQIKVAQGEKLEIYQDDIIFSGHSMECRINAEDAETGRPSPGRIIYYYRPAGIGVRVDDFIYSGYSVTPYYDSMCAKIITHAQTRNECICRMKRALNEIVIEGIKTNINLHKKILQHSEFIGNNYSTNFLSKNSL